MGRPVPAEIRHILRARHHPAQAVQCDHCGAHPHRPCTTVSGRHRLGGDPHDTRITAWAVAVACCPACQVAPGVPCHLDGRPLTTAHEARHTEAERNNP